MSEVHKVNDHELDYDDQEEVSLNSAQYSMILREILLKKSH